MRKTRFTGGSLPAGMSYPCRPIWMISLPAAHGDGVTVTFALNGSSAEAGP